MELKAQLPTNGIELRTSDFNSAGDSAGLADDRVLAEALRLAPNQGTVARCVLPYGWSGDNSGTVTPTTGADGSVYIAPFRAVIGSRTAASTDGFKAWRDIRSGVFVAGADPTAYASPTAPPPPPTSLAVKQALANNASGFARWDLIYAAVTPDTTALSDTRAVKSPNTGTVTVTPQVTVVGTKVAIGVVQGTPIANPVLPTVPADAGGIYYIPLAYVLVPNGWNNTSVCAPWQIMNVASPSPSALSKAHGGANLNTPNVQPTAAQLAAWANNSTTSISARPQWFLPQEMRGQESLVVPIDAIGSGAGWSHANFGLVDSSRDWRNRLFKTTVYAGFGGPVQADYAYSRQNNSNTSTLIPGTAHNETTPEDMHMNLVVQMGQSFRLSAGNWPGTPPSGYGVAFVTSANLTLLGAGIGLYVDTSGNLRVYINGVANNARLIFWVEATGPMPSY